eukprot:scaffold3909_cov117-Isochrysis_galbana.AAC.2
MVFREGIAQPVPYTTNPTARRVALDGIVVVTAVGEERVNTESIHMDLVTQDICELECDEPSRWPGQETV